MAENLTDKEWDELSHLKNEISQNPFCVVPEKQELFTQLLVKSLEGKGEYQSFTEPSNY